MRRPHKTTIQALKERKQGNTWRGLAVDLGFRTSFAATLNDIAASKPGSATVEVENAVRFAMGLRPLTRSGNNIHRPRTLIRPIVTRHANERRKALGVTWTQVIEAGLNALAPYDADDLSWLFVEPDTTPVYHGNKAVDAIELPTGEVVLLLED